MANEESVVTKKPRAVTKPSPSHPPYAEMITDAIATLKERTGSSQHAITKFIEEKHKSLPANFRKLLLGNLRKLVASEKVTKVKGSFKLPSADKKSAAKPKTVVAKPKSDKKVVGKPKKTPTKANATKAVATKAKPKTKAVVTKAKAARTSARSTPGKKVAAPKKAVTKKAATPKKAVTLKKAVTPKKTVTKKVGAPKKVKSPVKKAVGGKKAKK